MACKDCYSAKWCPYLHYFNHDRDVGCIDYIDANNYQTSVSTNTTVDCQIILPTNTTVDKKETPIRDYMTGKTSFKADAKLDL